MLKTWDDFYALLLINRHLNLKKIAKLANCTTFHNFFCKLNVILSKQKWNSIFCSNDFESIFGLDSGNSSSKTNSKGYLQVGVPENQINLQTRKFWTIPKTLNSHKKELNWEMKLNFSGITSVIEVIQWQIFEEDLKALLLDPLGISDLWQKPRPTEIPQVFFFPHALSSVTPGNYMSSTPPVWFFSGTAHFYV